MYVGLEWLCRVLNTDLFVLQTFGWNLLQPRSRVVGRCDGECST